MLVDCNSTAFKDNLDLVHIHTHKGCNRNCGQKTDISTLTVVITIDMTVQQNVLSHTYGLGVSHYPTIPAKMWATQYLALYRKKKLWVNN